LSQDPWSCTNENESKADPDKTEAVKALPTPRGWTNCSGMESQNEHCITQAMPPYWLDKLPLLGRCHYQLSNVVSSDIKLQQ